MSNQPEPLLIGKLQTIAQDNGQAGLATRLASIGNWIGDDLQRFTSELAQFPLGPPHNSRIEKAAQHLVEMGGKHLRPLCLAIAAKAGTGFDERARHLAVAVELVHSATLLHDDVIDFGETRRGRETSRMIYGNATSIYAGDWLLVQALMRVQRAAVPDVLDKMLTTIDNMVQSESLQLDNRGCVNSSFADYMSIVEGKTAGLFRWALYAGGRAGGLTEADCAALEQYGHHLGIAFQVVDDVLDIDGDPTVTGKALFCDLREGKMTYPLLVAMDRDASVREAIAEYINTTELASSVHTTKSLYESLQATSALAASQEFAVQHSQMAIAAIAVLPCPETVSVLTTVANATTFRNN